MHERNPAMTRRAALARIGGLAALALPGAIAACGSNGTAGPSTNGAGATSPGGTSGGTSAAPAGSPRVVEHRFGTTTVPADPRRIVAVGTTDADALVALGISPIAAYPNTGFGPGAFWPWLDDQAGMAAATPIELDASYRVNIEQIAALQPDLILAVNSYLEPEAEYGLLSAVAPTVSASSDPVAMSWDGHATEIAAALGRADAMATVVEGITARIQTVAADNPAFRGAALSFGGVFSPTEATIVFGADDYSRIFLSQLGFVVPPAQLAELPGLVTGGQGEVATQAPVSLERLDLIDGDVLVLGYLDPAVETQFTSLDVFKKVPAVADGRYVAADAGTVAALRIPSVLSVPYVLDELVPQLQTVLS